ncbi:Ubiquitin carboxyl-terminal hydrolases family 2 [Macleaya cordata]|uniref:Ubiquitin carboxyl-terminal hydrolase n=1 Tax=Macleaya cordata TaxID=56857 RepID=A0A200QQN8_MACCD|nr:Ubiquitin carboxyl-terminal hydrolases family 2 [Macleaya cordata]
MGKKVKKKTRNTHKERRVSSGSPVTALANSNQPVESVDGGILVVEERKPCTHIFKGVDFDKIASRIGSAESLKCEDCREVALDRRASKGRSKHGKKKGTGSVDRKSESKSIWVCLECGHFACGGVGLPITPQSHVLRHSKHTRHPCVIQFNNPNLRYCFQCTLLIPSEKSEENGEKKDFLADIVKLIKGQSSEGASMDVEDFRNDGDVMKVEASESLVFDGRGRYVVRGLLNLGNTCFFNSVMQNLLAVDPLREYFMKLDRFVGPLTMALKKLFNETNLESDSRNGISPKSLFGCICAKAPQFRGYQQQDSHELLRCLLDGLCNEESGSRKLLKSEKDDTTSTSGPVFVDMIFGGQLSSTVCCVECGHSSVVYESFLDLSLPVPTKKPSSRKPLAIARPKKKKLASRKDVRRSGKVQVKGKNDGAPILAQSASSLSENKESSSLEPASLSVKQETVASVDNFTWLDYMGPNTASDGFDLASQNCDNSIIQDTDNKLVYQTDVLQSSSESQSQVLFPNKEPTPDLDSSEVDACKDELPLQVQGSEVLLLPYKEENSTTEEIVTKEVEASSSIVGCEQVQQDTLDFDGLGDLFNEPEMDVVPNSESDMLEVGFFAGNSSESDPDEVDDKDAPVFIDTCLAHFTKAELLLSNEHGWHCENCSKILHGQVVEAKESQPKITLNHQINGGQLRSQCSSLDSDGNFSSSSELRNLDNGKPESDIDSTSTNETSVSHSARSDGSTNYSERKISPVDKEKDIDFTMATANCQVDDSFSANEPDVIGSHINQAQNMDSLISATVQESDESEEVDSKSLKVKRDATKRILINRAPSILTIHLKRFSQDTRGRLSKLSGHVSFGETIDLRPYMDPRSVEKDTYDYRLLGVVEHSGTMRGGHYVAYVRGQKSRGKTEEDNGSSTWFHASDAHVREVSLTEVLRSEAYILFYEKS